MIIKSPIPVLTPVLIISIACFPIGSGVSIGIGVGVSVGVSVGSSGRTQLPNPDTNSSITTSSLAFEETRPLLHVKRYSKS